MPSLKFICGCTTGNVIVEENLETMDAVGYDEEGFLICNIHHSRRYGWRSLPALPGSNVTDSHYAGFTALVIERNLVFGEPLVKS